MSVAIGVAACGWIISDRAVIIDITFRQFSNSPPNSPSMADTMTFIIMMDSTCTDMFSVGITFIGVLDFGPSKKYTPDLLRASGSDM